MRDAEQGHLGLDVTIRLTITRTDVRDPIFRYYHRLERSTERQPVAKTFHDRGRYWVTLFFPDLPDIFCLDEKHRRFGGLTLDEALRASQGNDHTRLTWGHEHFITAIWQGTQIPEFEKSYRRLREILGEKFPVTQQWEPPYPTPQNLKQFAATLAGESRKPTERR